MLYIKNNNQYALKFKLNGVSYEFDCFRQYIDTGNIATDGVTMIDDEVYKNLYEGSKVFRDFVDRGVLVKSSQSVKSAKTIDTLTKENDKLKAQLADAVKEASTAVNKEIEKKDEEIKSLKQKLESMSAKKAKSSEKASDDKVSKEF